MLNIKIKFILIILASVFVLSLCIFFILKLQSKSLSEEENITNSFELNAPSTESEELAEELTTM